MEPDLSFDAARAGLLEAFASIGGLTMPVVVREYNSNTEFKRRIDLVALDLLAPSSRTIH
jgi:hypothetical protein